MELILIGTMLLFVLMIVVLLTAVDKVSLYIYMATIFIGFILSEGIHSIVLEQSYVNFRDKSYIDYTADTSYRKWLIDNPIGAK